MYHGILPVFKPRGLTSHDVVFKLRKILKTKKVGHTGTLDPEVDGVLPICIGQATKVSDYVMDMGKTYHAEVTIGVSTTTEDQTGDVVDQKQVDANVITNQVVDDILKEFTGWITQIPPMYSSVKVNGKKLYEYARQGLEVERPERQVYIENIQRVSDVITTNGKATFEMDVTCGKGTYIRTLATDIGKALGYPAHMSRLTRTNSGGFDVAQALTLDTIQERHDEETLTDALLPLIYGLKAFPQYKVHDANLIQRIKNGQKFERAQFDIDFDQTLIMVDATTDQVLAIYEVHPSRANEIKPKKVFN
ncbi:tRNA pseudouridine(55) synthase TruB [Staphylococcus muscae]|uniref:tRNA pseudouridine synthase B n=1 Tax=Staphylococcus muscae TaxID=1294 RepID=A0A240C2U4_9STAP|nr:tRNA pseudouridine(55) synthase TruB [Staphylococcus muscae]AVQ32885.1 tRNA pseudouridine(55) synthase TruB [Staphylococcus muscae]PNZ06055.1 tRNA pseudouridine(55) synthase TruB [Staphylococcus muscae]GGA80355.1 tRNA pseudouridine synthase B [Staphylococcus muscae]SNW01942.1 tRNA pseudouridine synthase B [Staphylococcus muscae]